MLHRWSSPLRAPSLQLFHRCLTMIQFTVSRLLAHLATIFHFTIQLCFLEPHQFFQAPLLRRVPLRFAMIRDP